MGSSDEPAKKWSLVLEGAGGQLQTFIVRGTKREDVDAVMVAIRAELRNMATSGGCRSLLIGVHVEGPACDHEVGVR